MVEEFQLIVTLFQSQTRQTINPIKDLLRILENMFGNKLSEVKGKCILAITQGDEKDNMELLKKRFKAFNQKIASLKEFSQGTKQFFSELSKEALFIFKMYQQNELVNSKKIAEDIKSKLSQREIIKQQRIQITLSQKARHESKEVLHQIIKEITKYYQQIGQIIENLNKDKKSVDLIKIKQGINKLIDLGSLLHISNISQHLKSVYQICFEDISLNLETLYKPFFKISLNINALEILQEINEKNINQNNCINLKPIFIHNLKFLLKQIQRNIERQINEENMLQLKQKLEKSQQLYKEQILKMSQQSERISQQKEQKEQQIEELKRQNERISQNQEEYADSLRCIQLNLKFMKEKQEEREKLQKEKQEEREKHQKKKRQLQLLCMVFQVGLSLI